MTIAQRFDEFLKALRPSDGQLDLVKTELDFLESKLKDFVVDDDRYHLVKVLRSGGYAKSTLLKRHETGDFDADAAIYIKAADGEAPPLKNLLDYVEALLRRAYENRTKRKPTFDRGPKSAVRVKFEVTPKINIDAVPVIDLPHDSIPNWGTIPRRDGELRNTSISEHVRFVADRNKVRGAVPFHQLLMLAKWWRNHSFDEQLHDRFSSFALELVFAKAFDESARNLTGAWLGDLLAVGTWILRHRFETPIKFPDRRVPAATSAESADFSVIDPMNLDNNVAHDWTRDDVSLFLKEVNRLCDVMQDALNEAAADELSDASLILDQVFPNFSNWSVE
jgi:hypothetical protein